MRLSPANRAACILLFLVAGCIVSPTVAPMAVAIRYPLQQFTSPSGLKTVYEVEPDVGTAGVALVVQSGSADEPPGKAGLAHLVEHLAFQGQHGGAAFHRRLAMLGVGEWNGMTTWDHTTYYAFGPTRNLPQLVSLFADMLDDPLASVDAAAFEHERQIVRNELHWRAENGTPGEAFGLLASDVFPPTYPYAHSVIGSEETLARLTLDDARAYAKEHYRTSNCVLAVSSPAAIETQHALVADVESSHGWTARPSSPASSPPGLLGEVPNAASRALPTFERPVATPTLWIGWSIPSEGSPEADAARLVSLMVGGTFWTNVYDHDADIADVDAWVVTGSQAGLFVVEATLKKGTDPKASADSLIRTMLHGLGERTYLESNFEIYKRNVATHQIAAEEPVVGRTVRLADSMMRTGDPTYWRAQAQRTIALRAGTVSAFYRRYLNADRAHAVFIQPLSLGTRPVVGAGAIANGTPALGRDAVQVGPLDPADVRSWMRAPGVGLARRAKLANGLEVIVVPRPGSPFHSVVLAYHGGYATERVQGSGVASLWAKERFNVSAATFGVEYSDTVETDSTTETLRATGSDLQLTLRQLKSENTFEVYWPPPQFSSRIEAFEREDRSPDSEFERALNAAFFGSNPLGRITTSAQLRIVRPNDVYTFIDAVRRPSNGVLVVVGDVDPASAIRLASESVGESGAGRAQTGPEVPLATPFEHGAASAGERLIVRDKRGSTHAVLSFVCTLPKLESKTWATASVLAAGLNDDFHTELRERAAASYGVLGAVEIFRGGSAVFRMRADVDYARLPPAIRSVRNFVEHPAGQALNDDWLARARQGAARSYNVDLGTTKSLAGYVVDLWNLGWPIETLDRFPDDVFDAKLEDVARMAERCRSDWVLGLLGDKPRIDSAVGDWAP